MNSSKKYFNFFSNRYIFHCVKSVQMRSFFWSAFCSFQTRKNSVFWHFSHSVPSVYLCLLRFRKCIIWKIARTKDYSKLVYRSQYHITRCCFGFFDVDFEPLFSPSFSPTDICHIIDPNQTHHNNLSKRKTRVSRAILSAPLIWKSHIVTL